MLSLINTIGAETAVFLFGINLAIIYSYWPEPWLIIKLMAVSTLLLFTAIAMFTGLTDAWLVFLGIFAVILDSAAVGGIYHALRLATRTDGVLVAYRKR